jgi:hypothetical protein
MERYPKPLKKYDLERTCGLARETIRAWIPRMERYEWIRGREVGKSNAGKKMVEYALTERGIFQASCLNPTLRPRAKRLLGTNYREMEEARTRFRRKRMSDYLEQWLPILRQFIQSGTAQPGFYYCLELIADKEGKIQLGNRSKVGIRRP